MQRTDTLSIERLRPWIAVRFTRAGGPGGQNVNKTATRVELLFDLAGCDVLTDDQRARARRKLRRRLDAAGRLRVVVQRYRSQRQNRAAAERRLVELLAEALRQPAERRPTRPTAASRLRRLARKRRRGEIKRERQRPTLDS